MRSDGEPTEGISDTQEILMDVRRWLSQRRTPLTINAIAFLMGEQRNDPRPRQFMAQLASVTPGGVYRCIDPNAEVRRKFTSQNFPCEICIAILFSSQNWLEKRIAMQISQGKFVPFSYTYPFSQDHEEFMRDGLTDSMTFENDTQFSTYFNARMAQIPNLQSLQGNIPMAIPTPMPNTMPMTPNMMPMTPNAMPMGNTMMQNPMVYIIYLFTCVATNDAKSVWNANGKNSDDDCIHLNFVYLNNYIYNIPEENT